jgi:hypothetical protein
VYSAEKSLKEHGDKVSSDERLKIERAITDAKEALKSEDLERIKKTGLLRAIEQGIFAGVKRAADGGKGAQGVFPVERGRYLNPFFALMGSRIHEA